PPISTLFPYTTLFRSMFINYAKKFTDLPFMILLDDFKDSLKAGRFLRESDLGIESENADWKPVILDENSGEKVAPNGTMGQRWRSEEHTSELQSRFEL